ncbi:MAG: hypothetical protein JRH11_15685 [Deltaproteobacteria bacterium]|nr:hypothetical protein [Deltaproteobacteria bacterium]
MLVWKWALVASVCLSLSGCFLSHRTSSDPGTDGAVPIDAGCVNLVYEDGGPSVVESVDLLLMVDNSNSMNEEQASLAVALPNLIRGIISGDVDLDGDVDFAPVGSLHLGVVTSDMGTGGVGVPTCNEPNFGDDGVLRTRSGSDDRDCAGSFPTFLEFDPRDEVTVEEFAARAACVTTAGIGGCGFEQQLDAVLKAVTPSRSPVGFAMGTSGHSDGANSGFLRDDSILVVLVVTDENDCSARDPELFNPSTSIYTGDLNLRCFTYPGAVHPVERYIDGLLALRSEQPDRLVFATIVGIPLDLSGESATTILRDPRMTERVDPDLPTRLAPSCNVPGRGFAFPPTRIVQVGEGITDGGGRSLNLSICQEDFSPAVGLILEEVAAAARPICLDP